MNSCVFKLLRRVRTSFHRSIGQSISTAHEVYYEILIFWMDSFVSVCLILLKGEQEMVRLGRWSGAQGGPTANWFQYDGLLGSRAHKKLPDGRPHRSFAAVRILFLMFYVNIVTQSMNNNDGCISRNQFFASFRKNVL